MMGVAVLLAGIVPLATRADADPIADKQAQAARLAGQINQLNTRQEQLAEEEAAAAAAESTARSATISDLPPVSGHGASAAIAEAQRQIGKPYEWGAAGPGSFDCSGLTMWAWRAGGVSLPHYTKAQYDATTHVSL